MKASTLGAILVIVGCGGSPSPEDPGPQATAGGEPAPPVDPVAPDEDDAPIRLVADNDEVGFELYPDGRLVVEGEPVGTVTENLELRGSDGAVLASVAADGRLLDAGGQPTPIRLTEDSIVADNGAVMRVGEDNSLVSGDGQPWTDTSVHFDRLPPGRLRTALFAFAVTLVLSP